VNLGRACPSFASTSRSQTPTTTTTTRTAASASTLPGGGSSNRPPSALPAAPAPAPPRQTPTETLPRTPPGLSTCCRPTPGGGTHSPSSQRPPPPPQGQGHDWPCCCWWCCCCCWPCAGRRETGGPSRLPSPLARRRSCGSPEGTRRWQGTGSSARWTRGGETPARRRCRSARGPGAASGRSCGPAAPRKRGAPTTPRRTPPSPCPTRPNATAGMLRMKG
jgi:hypothetical protein